MIIIIIIITSIINIININNNSIRILFMMKIIFNICLFIKMIKFINHYK